MGEDLLLPHLICLEIGFLSFSCEDFILLALFFALVVLLVLVVKPYLIVSCDWFLGIAS